TPLDADERGEHRAHHERVQHDLGGQHDAQRAPGRFLARIEQLEGVEQEGERQPHREGEQGEQVQVLAEEAERLPEDGAHYLTLEPEGTSLSRVSSDTVPSWEAASTMPMDSTPIRVAGSRLATITTLRPTRASGSKAPAPPAPRVGVSPPPWSDSLATS